MLHITKLMSLLLVSLLIGCSDSSEPLTATAAQQRLDQLLRTIAVTTQSVQRRASVTLTQNKLADTLPPISDFPLVVNPTPNANTVAIEIFSSSEKAGEGTDGWLVQVAQAFNRRQITLPNGKTAQIQVRRIASGTAYQMLAARKHQPHAYTPSNALWGEMVKASGVRLTPVMASMVGNTAGVVIKKSVAQRLRNEFPQLGVDDLINAVVQGKLIMGYTNPYASSTGLNFLVTVLHTFSGNGAQMLEPATVSALQSFQHGVPFIAMTTLQLRDSVANNGALDAFVMEYQTFNNITPSMAAEYEFIPFGVRHDNPLYAMPDLTPEQRIALMAFAKHASSKTYRRLADDYGFNGLTTYRAAFELPDGDTLQRAQAVWKRHKNAGRKVTAIFLADISGSMNGGRLNRLRQSLLIGADFITPQNEIGLIAFNDRPIVMLRPKPFDLVHKAAFHAAVQDLRAQGGTALYDGIAVSLAELLKVRRAQPDNQLMLFVLTDGENRDGHPFDDIREIIHGLGIPVYTIGYEANLPVLQEISSLVEAASINAGQSDVAYKIGNLLNAQM